MTRHISVIDPECRSVREVIFLEMFVTVRPVSIDLMDRKHKLSKIKNRKFAKNNDYPSY